MLYFRSEGHLKKWLAENKFSRGAMLTLEQTWQLSRMWYGDRMREDFTGRTRADITRIFGEIGLAGPFWSFGDTMA